MALKADVQRLIQNEMKAQGVTQADLHRRLKITRVSVHHMMKPTRNFTLERLERLAKALDRKVTIRFAPRTVKTD